MPDVSSRWLPTGCLLRLLAAGTSERPAARRLARISDTIKTSVRWRVDSVSAGVYNSYMGSVRTTVLGRVAVGDHGRSGGTADFDGGTEAEMTTVTIAPAEEAGLSVGRPVRAMHRSQGYARPSSPAELAGDDQPRVADVRPAVRLLRGPDGAEQVRVRPQRRYRVPGAPRPVGCDRSYEADLHGSRLTRRGKMVVGAIWLVFAAAIVLMVSRPAEVPIPAETATVTVKSGDTLWALADDLAPDDDPRVTVDQIIELNGLRSAGDIHPGDLLVVPVSTN